MLGWEINVTLLNRLFLYYRYFKSARMLLDLIPEILHVILFSCLQVYLMCQGKLWLNSTVQSAWMFTHPSRHGITTQMAHTLVQAFLTCCSWYTLSTDQRGQPTSLYQGTVQLLFVAGNSQHYWQDPPQQRWFVSVVPEKYPISKCAAEMFWFLKQKLIWPNRYLWMFKYHK